MGVAEKLALLDGAADELLATSARWRVELSKTDFAALRVPDKVSTTGRPPPDIACASARGGGRVTRPMRSLAAQCGTQVARKLVERFPDDALKESAAGYGDFASHAGRLVDSQAGFYKLLQQLGEFREETLSLLAELSKEVVKFSIDLNELLFVAYFTLALKYAKLHLLLSRMLTPDGKGKLMFMAYCRAHAIANGAGPHGAQQLGRYLADYEHALPRLQEDFTRCSLRVADALVPLGMKLLQYSDVGFYKSEASLSPVTPSAAGGRKVARSAADDGAEAAGQYDPDPLLAHLGEARQWVVYGLLLCPDELGEPGATDLLTNLLNTMYVLPIHGTDALMPHAEFDADSKLLARWLRGRKDDVKRFQASLRESRVTALKSAPRAHLETRLSLSTKLGNLYSFISDSPQLLQSRLPLIISALRLAQAEIEWWALHADATLDEVPRKLREEIEPGRAEAFQPQTVVALVRWSMQLKQRVQENAARLAQDAGVRLAGPVRSAIEALIPAAGLDQCPPRVRQLLQEVPAHLAAAAEVDCDLRGLRINALRVTCGMSAAGAFSVVQSSAALRELLSAVSTAATLSAAVDGALYFIDAATAAPTLLASKSQLISLFSTALQARPSDCLHLLTLAAAGSVSLSLLETCLQQLDKRLCYLIDICASHFHAQRTSGRAPDSVDMGSASHQLCTLCAALDAAPPLTVARARLSMREWLREHVEHKLQREVASMLLDSSGSLLPPRAAYERLLDLSHALALARHYVRIDLHEALNMTLAREFGAFEMVSPEAAEKAEAAAAAAPATAASRGEVSVRSLGLSAKTAERSACAPKGGAQGVTPPLLEALKEWLRGAMRKLTAPNAPLFLPALRSFEPTVADARHFGALCKMVGTSGTMHLQAVAIEEAVRHATRLRGVLRSNKEGLHAFQKHFHKTRQLMPSLILNELDIALESCHALGVALVTRSLLLEGTAEACTSLLPKAVPAFVRSLGEQQLPTGDKAGATLPTVARLLAMFGMPGDMTDDALLQGEIVNQWCARPPRAEAARASPHATRRDPYPRPPLASAASPRMRCSGRCCRTCSR